MKNFITYLLLGLSWCSVWGQIQVREVIGAQGGSGTIGQTTVLFSVGEPIISATEINVGLQASEGFFQPLSLLAAPLSDSVWPGDANHDGVADQYDLLSLGIGYGSTGPARPNASLNWVGQWAPDWNDSLLTYVNYKHLDCNGDGLIGPDDTLALDLNFGLVHNKGDLFGTDGPPLYLEIVEDSLGVGDTAHLQIFLGTDSVIAEDIYGLAFSLELDTSFFQVSTAQTTYDNSWLGVKNVDMLTFDKPLQNEGMIAMAMVGTDHSDRTGYGLVGKISIIMIDDLAGKQDVYEKVHVRISAPLALNRQGQLRSLSLSDPDTVILHQSTTAIHAGQEVGLQVYPNPADGEVLVRLQNARADGYLLRSVHGQIVGQGDKTFREQRIKTDTLAAGMYYLQIRVDGVWISHKLYIFHR